MRLITGQVTRNLFLLKNIYKRKQRLLQLKGITVEFDIIWRDSGEKENVTVKQHL